MVRGFAFHESVLVFKFFNKESSSHAGYLPTKSAIGGAGILPAGDPQNAPFAECKQRNPYEQQNSVKAGLP
jgi:hypothetical protein